jgi:hypothetical protein
VVRSLGCEEWVGIVGRRQQVLLLLPPLWWQLLGVGWVIGVVVFLGGEHEVEYRFSCIVGGIGLGVGRVKGCWSVFFFLL